MAPKLVIRKDGAIAFEGVNGAPQPGMFRATGTPGGTSPMYGHGGLFGICDADPTVINAMVGPMGVESILTWRGSNVQSPYYESLVWMGSSGYGQSGLCADCGKPSFKQCTQTSCFGRICQMTNEHAIDQIGLHGTFNVPRVALFGSITDPSGNVLVQEGQEISDMFTLELAGAGYNLRYRVGWNMWNGNPANNLGGAWQFPGFQLIVNTGKFDQRTGVTCPGLDSYVRAYNAVVGAAGSPAISAYLAGAMRSIKYRMNGMNKNSDAAVTWAVMHPRTWDCVARALACEYGLICNTATDRNDALAMANLHARIMDTMMIPIDYKWYPVKLDNIMPSNAVPYGSVTAFESDIYLLTTALEGETILWGEYQDFGQTAGDTIAWFRRMFGSTPFISDANRYMWAPTTHGGFCFDARVLVKPRVIGRMPQLCARITGVRCVPLGSYPDVTGSGGTYELVGGISSKPYQGMYGYCGSLGMP